MRKLLILSLFAAISFSACKKEKTSVSNLYTYSTPTIIVTGAQYYSIPVGGALPTIAATAYDSFYHEDCTVLLDQSTLDNTKAGLYVVNISARNKYGMQGTKSIYVAVTDIDAAVDISGQYKRTSNSVLVNVTKLATGLYMTDNVGGVDSIASPSSASAVLPAFFVQTSLTDLALPAQPTSQGTLIGDNGTVNMAPPITYSYVITDPSTVFGQSTRTFVKQ
jgi:hypothetical protein